MAEIAGDEILPKHDLIRQRVYVNKRFKLYDRHLYRKMNPAVEISILSYQTEYSQPA